MKTNLKLLIFLACLGLIKAQSDCEGCQIEKEEIQLKFEEQNDQNQETQSDEQFLAVHVNQLGVERLNLSQEIVAEIVNEFLPREYKFNYYLNITREIVNGFKYEILFVMRDEQEEDKFCLMDVIEKPRLMKDTAKFRRMVYNNCSLTNSPDDRIRFEYEVNPTQRTDVTSEEMRFMEDQIILETDKIDTGTATVVLDDVTLSPLDPSSMHILDNFFNMNHYFPHTTTAESISTDEKISASQVTNSEAQKPHDASSIKSQEYENEHLSIQRSRNNEALKELEMEIKKAFSELFQTDPEFQMNIIALINRKDDSNVHVNYNYVVNILTLKLKDKIEAYNQRRNSDNDPHSTVEPLESISIKDSHENSDKGVPGGINPASVNDEEINLFLKEAIAEVNVKEEPDYVIKEIKSATQQVVSGILYRIKAVLTVADEEVICDFEIWEQSWIKNGREVKINCNNSKLYKFNQDPVGQRGKSRKRRQLVGAPADLTQEEQESAHNLLKQHISRLDTGSEAPLEPVRIDKVTKQVVAGIKYKFFGLFKIGDNQKYCTVEIWHRSWINTEDGTQLGGKCDDGALTFKTVSRIKRSEHSRPLHEFAEHRHHHEQRHHRMSVVEEMKEVKAEYLFDEFITKYNRRYLNDDEHKQRMRIFKRNLHKIEMLNKHEQGTAKYGITEFADMTEKEYLRKTGLLGKRRHFNDLDNPIADIPEVKDLPINFDWRDKGVITDVKNQQQCGSCWSFSVTGNIEGLHAIKTGKLEAYSEQELLDCDTTDNACNGGYMDDAFKAIEKIGGLELEDDYPYLARKQKKCMFNQTKSHVNVKGVVDLPKDEVAMQKFLVSTGPISIGINANAMQFYRGGVSHPWKILCKKTNLDHGVLIVGYGIKEYPMFNKTLPYWTIKNSWGKRWGEQGYYRVYRGDNTCGVSEMASSAVLE